jgi:RNA polymerase sigma-70 factor (ECF subfamily)
MDQHEFARQFEAAYPRLWLIATSLVGNRTDAEDIVQEAAVIAYRKSETFQAGTNFAAWVARIVRYCAANHRRRASELRFRATDPVMLDQQSGRGAEPRSVEASGDLEPWQSLLDDRLLRVLRDFPPDARACLLLRIVDGRSYAEIAELLGIPAGTAMSHVHRSKQRMRQCFDNGRAGPTNGEA